MGANEADSRPLQVAVSTRQNSFAKTRESATRTDPYFVNNLSPRWREVLYRHLIITCTRHRITLSHFKLVHTSLLSQTYHSLAKTSYLLEQEHSKQC